MKLSLFLSSLLLLGAQTVGAAESSGTSSSVRPPDFQWWRDGRFGMFIHWGPAALTGKEISWTRKSTGIEKYDALYKEFNPVNFNATEWVATAKAA
ncbi:MAG: alpha-L-fucosidase, partial [Luteolibacter sp.]